MVNTIYSMKPDKIVNINLIKIEFLVILSYEHLTAAHVRPCAEDLV